MIVLDANILIRAVLGRRVRLLLDSYPTADFFAPDVAFADAQRYLPALLQRVGKPRTAMIEALPYLASIIKSVDRELYSAFEDEARQRLRSRDEEDWPVLASALALGCPIWTEDADFFGTGVAVWTTNRIEMFLRSHQNHPGADED